MYWILFDDNFYNKFTKNQPYMKKLTRFILERTNVNFVFFHPFVNTCRQTPQLAYEKIQFEKAILNKRRGKKLDLDEVVNIYDSDFIKLTFSEIFVGKIYYLNKIYPEVKLIISLCEEVHGQNKKIDKGFVFYINHYAKELDSNIKQWIHENVIHIDYPNKNIIFPAIDICYGYEDLRESALKSSSNDKISFFSEIGIEVAARNHYDYDAKLTQLNKNKAKKDKNGQSPKRKVFKSSNGELYYLSIDFENGGFEVFNKNAKYLGQYRFSGIFEKESDPKNHKLYLN